MARPNPVGGNVRQAPRRLSFTLIPSVNLVYIRLIRPRGNRNPTEYAVDNGKEEDVEDFSDVELIDAKRAAWVSVGRTGRLLYARPESSQK